MGHLEVNYDGNTGKTIYVYHVTGQKRVKVATSSVFRRRRTIYSNITDGCAAAKDFTLRQITDGLVWGYLGLIGHPELENLPVKITK